jgi:uroporphyrinogen decarboxylase
MITQLECFRATVEHEPHEGFLFYASFTPDLERRVRAHYGVGDAGDLRERLGMYNPVEISLRPPADVRKPAFSRYFDGVDIPADAFVNSLGVLEIPHGFYHFTRYVSPLRNAERFEELEAFSYPTVEGHSESHMSGEVEAAHRQGRVASSWVGHMYEDAWQIRGYQPFLVDMIDRPEWCEYILDRLAERNLANACAAARAGVDAIRTGDDVANQQRLMFRHDHWRRFMKSRWAKVYAAARAIKPDVQIWYHSDGNVGSIIPELIEIGVTILNPVQPECVDPLSVKRQYGDKLVIDGAIGTQTTMPFGTAGEVRDMIRERARTIGYDGAYIISPTHVLEPEVPLENIAAFVETAGGLV